MISVYNLNPKNVDVYKCVFLLQLVKELGYPVKYIVLPTFAYEHKIFVGPFSRKFPKAEVWVAPRQWSWPLNLPLEFFGIFRAKTLKDEDMSTPWADDIKQKVLSSPEVGNRLSTLIISNYAAVPCTSNLINFCLSGFRNWTIC